MYELYRKEKKIPSKKFWDQFDKTDTWFKGLQKWAGLQTESFAYDRRQRFIATDNDRGADFSIIANTVEKVYEVL